MNIPTITNHTIFKEYIVKKIALKPGVVNFPMPVALVGSEVDGKMNFMTVAWISMASYAPPKIVVTLGDHHVTNTGIKANGVFSVNFPSSSQATVTDYCGIVSAAKVDKGKLFSLFFGTSPKAPMIEEFPLCVECKLDKTIANGRNESFFGDIVGIHADEAILKNDKVDWDAFGPLILNQGGAEYRSVGQVIGKAWNIGKTYKPE